MIIGEDVTVFGNHDTRSLAHGPGRGALRTAFLTVALIPAPLFKTLFQLGRDGVQIWNLLVFAPRSNDWPPARDFNDDHGRRDFVDHFNKRLVQLVGEFESGRVLGSGHE